MEAVERCIDAELVRLGRTTCCSSAGIPGHPPKACEAVVAAIQTVARLLDDTIEAAACATLEDAVGIYNWLRDWVLGNFGAKLLDLTLRGPPHGCGCGRVSLGVFARKWVALAHKIVAPFSLVEAEACAARAEPPAEAGVRWCPLCFVVHWKWVAFTVPRHEVVELFYGAVPEKVAMPIDRRTLMEWVAELGTAYDMAGAIDMLRATCGEAFNPDAQLQGRGILAIPHVIREYNHTVAIWPRPYGRMVFDMCGLVRALVDAGAALTWAPSATVEIGANTPGPGSACVGDLLEAWKDVVSKDVVSRDAGANVGDDGYSEYVQQYEVAVADYEALERAWRAWSGLRGAWLTAAAGSVPRSVHTTNIPPSLLATVLDDDVRIVVDNPHAEPSNTRNDGSRRIVSEYATMVAWFL